MYGAQETNPLVDPQRYHEEFDPERTVDLTDPELETITRLRLLSDPGHPYWDISYVHGVLKDGTQVRVQLPVHNLRKRGSINGQLYAMCRDAGVYGKGLGIYQAVSTLV
jgi:hypothetical protein